MTGRFWLVLITTRCVLRHTVQTTMAQAWPPCYRLQKILPQVGELSFVLFFKISQIIHPLLIALSLLSCVTFCFVCWRFSRTLSYFHWSRPIPDENNIRGFLGIHKTLKRASSIYFKTYCATSYLTFSEISNTVHVASAFCSWRLISRSGKIVTIRGATLIALVAR